MLAYYRKIGKQGVDMSTNMATYTSIKTKDHADQLWCVVPTPQTRGVEPMLF